MIIFHQGDHYLFNLVPVEVTTTAEENELNEAEKIKQMLKSGSVGIARYEPFQQLLQDSAVTLV